jgi:hypothetical protein
MEVELLATHEPRWADFLDHCRHDFYHLPRYVDFCAARDGGTACAAYVRDGEHALLLPLVLRPVNGGADGCGWRDAASPYGYPGPLVWSSGSTSADQDVVAAALGAVIERLRGEQIVSLFVRAHPLLSPPLAAPAATVVAHGHTVSIDLTRSSDELWRQTAKGHRTEIARAERDGHLARFDDSIASLAHFGSLYRETMTRRDAAAAYHFPDSYFVGLRDAIGDRLRLCVVEIDGEIAAGGLFVFTRGLVEYHLSATDHRYERQRPTKLMLHFVRSWAAAHGCTRFHLGGGVGGREDSLFAFKAAFSPDRHLFQTLRAVCDEAAFAELVRNSGPDVEPPDLAGFFPPYRRQG